MAVKVRVAHKRYATTALSHQTIWYENKQSNTTKQKEEKNLICFCFYAICNQFYLCGGYVPLVVMMMAVAVATAIKIKMRPIDITDMREHKTYIESAMEMENNTYLAKQCFQKQMQ